MAQPRTLEAQIQQLPADQLEIANRILETIPQAHRPAAQRLLGRIASLPSPRDALIHLESIVTSENFRPSYLGTLTLIAERGGSNVTSALSEFERLIGLGKFNQHVARTARLAIIRAGENSHEALRGLYFLVSNPSFTPNSLTIALPDRFLAFLDQAIRDGGGAPHLSIRAMGSMFANSQFSPSDLTRREAREFGQVLRQVQHWSRGNSLYAMDALCSLLANGAIRPQDLNAASARELGTLVNIVVEYTRVSQASPSREETLSDIRRAAAYSSVSAGAEDANLLPQLRTTDLSEFNRTIEGATRRLNLILGHGTFTLGMLSDDGLLNRAINDTTGDIPSALQAFYGVMRASRRRPEIMALTSHLFSQRDEINLDPLAILRIVGSLESNSRLAPLLSTRDFPQRLASMLAALGSSPAMLGSTSAISDAVARGELPGSFTERPYLLPLTEMLGRDNFTPEAFGMLETMVETLSRAEGEGVGNIDVGIFLLNAALSRPNTRPSQRMFTDIIGLARQLRERTNTDYSGFANMLSSRFLRPDMLSQPNGLIPYLVRVAPPDQIGGSARHMATIFRRMGNGSQTVSIMRQLIRFGGRDTSAAFYVLASISANPSFTRRNYQALSSLLERTGRYSFFALNLYERLLQNPQLASSLRSEEYMQRLARVLVRSRGSESSHARLAARSISSIMSDDRFRPEMMEQLEYVSRIAGPHARHVFNYLSSMLDNSQVEMIPILSRKFIRYLTGMAVLYSTYGGRHTEMLHAQFAEHLQDRGLLAINDISEFSRIRSSFEALVRNAGPEMGADALRCYALSFRHFTLSDEDSVAMGRFIRQNLSGLEGDARDEMITNLAGMLGTSRINLVRIVLDNPRLYQRGRALAQRLIPGCTDPTVFLNFAYGIDTVGEGVVTDLYRNFGMRYFARYTEEMLEQQHESIGGAERPPVLVIFPHSDYNGAFYAEARQFDRLLETHNVIVYEREDERGFYQAIRDFRRRYGSTGTIIIGGHGTPTTITLGESNEQGQLDLSDEAELAEIGTVLRPGGTVILDSCSTGASSESIGALISKVLGARLYAPQRPGNISQLHVSRSGSISASYTVSRREYSAGTAVSGR